MSITEALTTGAALALVTFLGEPMIQGFVSISLKIAGIE